jgi:gliding motility-associated-like protein
MKKWFIILLVSACATTAHASHISGGEMYYTYLGKSPTDANKLRYAITLLLYKDTTVTGPTVASLLSNYNISIYRGDNNALVGNYVLSRKSYDFMKLSTYDKCLSSFPRVEFAVSAYEVVVDLDPNADGYFASHSQCCRVSGVLNMNSNTVGTSYWVKIPGINNNPFAPENSSATFLKKDTILVCVSSPLQLDFSAVDPDKDSLVYSFAPGYIGAGPPPNQLPLQSDAPPYNTVSYFGGFSFDRPFGNTSTQINAKTGLVSGRAPAITGIYLIAVKVEEYRNGKKISEHQKEFQVKVENCSITAAELKPQYVSCDGFTLRFENESTSPSINGYLWNFGDGATSASTLPTPTHTYKDTGTYVLKLLVTSTGGCQDSTTSIVKVYPTFKTDFSVTGTCVLNNYAFKDLTSSRYGIVNSWRWSFGDAASTADSASTKDTVWKYSSAQKATVTLISTNNKGCIDTLTKQIDILDKPQINLPFKDTLICSNDTLPLKAVISNTTSISWVPGNNVNKLRIIGANTANPTVYPNDSTKYYVTVMDNGCTSTDSVMVNVLQFIKVDLKTDSTICRGDSFALAPTSFALSYIWRSSGGDVVDPLKNPIVKPLSNTQYFVTANLGKCQDKDSILIKVVATPSVTATLDTTICFNTTLPLQATISASKFSWSPTSSLTGFNTLRPVARPVNSTNYVIAVSDTLGCPKIVTDTIRVTVVPRIIPNAGNDTIAVIGKPMQLGASGGLSYLWTPSTFLNNPLIANPVFTGVAGTDSVVYTVRVFTQAGCYAEDNVTVTIFNGISNIWVPSGFTPNKDGKNDILRPITKGIKQLIHFNVFNRWGQLIYSTNRMGEGWDGTYKNELQPSGAYVYEAVGIDYADKKVYTKGTSVIIR